MRKFLVIATLILTSLSPSFSQSITKEVEVKENLNILPSTTPEGILNSRVIFLADQLVRNVNNRFRYEPTVVTTFVNLDNMKETSTLGRLLAENLMHELQVRGWRVFDIRLAKDIVVKPQGEFSITRDIKNVRNYYVVNSVITGTYAITSNAVIVNARIIDVKTGVVVSSGQIVLPIEEVSSLLSDRSSSGSTIRIKGEY
jgi:TolB-like protein